MWKGRLGGVGRAVAILVISTASAVGCPSVSEAQIVNVTQLSGKVVAQGLSGTAGAAVDSLICNSPLLTASGGATLYYRSGPWLALITSAAAYGVNGKNGEFAKNPFQSKAFEHLRLRRDIGSGWSVEAFGQHEYGRWRRLKLRALAGSGLRLDAEVTPEAQVVFGVAASRRSRELGGPHSSKARAFST